MKHLAKAAAVFWSWCILSAAAQFIPAATIVRDVDSFHVRKNGEFTQINGAWHSPQLTHPEPWLAAVRAHLRRT